MVVEVYLVKVPDGDRVYVWRSMTPERYRKFKAQNPDTQVFRARIKLPGVNHDEAVYTEAHPFEGEFGDGTP